MIKLFKKIAVPIIVALLIGIVLLYSSRNRNTKAEKILSAKKIGSAYITSLNSCTKCALTYNYVFRNNGIDYNGTSASSHHTDEYHYLGNTCLHRSFPVVYDSLHPEISKILITPTDFKKYNIPFPDSLNWVKQYVE